MFTQEKRNPNFTRPLFIEDPYLNLTSRGRWDWFEQNLAQFIKYGKQKSLNISFRSDPPEITDWSFLLKFPNLESLSISNLALRTLPSEIFQLSGLKKLEIGDLLIKEIPPEIGSLTKLEEFKLSYLYITRLPLEVGLLTELKTLEIYGCLLEDLNTEIFTLQKLEVLSISKCHLTEIPPEIRQLHQLKTLNIHRNQISEIPPEIGRLKNLTGLSVRENQITDLPSEIGQLTALEYLDISWTSITKLPLSMENCSNITKINDIEQVEPIPLSIYVNWPKYGSNGVSVLLPPEKYYGVYLEEINPAFINTYAKNCKFVLYPIEELFQELLDGKDVTQDVFWRLDNEFTPSMKSHLRNTLPRDHPYIIRLDKMGRLKLPDGLSIQR